jgi:5-oxopent-3-ene-1,2,5-tricarboxylate decarboxylase / 2-hydroxyhepta-2,4-diene-1,7-dioate isomerase
VKLAQFELKHSLAIGFEVDGRWLDFTKAQVAHALLEESVGLIPRTTIGHLLDRGEFEESLFLNVAAFVRKIRLQRYLQLPPGRVLRAPVLRPGKIVALGLNYALHAKEGTLGIPSEPVLFMKPGSCVIGPGETIRIPRGIGRMDHEAELAVVIGKTATQIRKRDAWKVIAGYTVCNDVTARSLQTRDINNRHPWFRSKSFDTFAPLGPWIVTQDELPAPVRLAIECRVNGKIRQKANTKSLLFDIPTVIEYITRHITLEPGDIVSTGTPEGIGPIRHGDTVVCGIQSIGELRNPVRSR